MSLANKLLNIARVKLAAVTNNPIPFEDAIKLTPAQQREIALAVPEGDFRYIYGPDGKPFPLGKGQTGYAAAGFVNPKGTNFHNTYIDGKGPLEIPPEIMARDPGEIAKYVNARKQLGNASIKFEVPGGEPVQFKGQLERAKQIMGIKNGGQPIASLFPLMYTDDIGGPNSIVTPRLLSADYLGMDKVKGSYAAVRDYINSEAEKITRATDPTKSARGLGISQALRGGFPGNQIDQMLIRNPVNGKLYETSDLMLLPSLNGGRLRQADLHNYMFDPATLTPKAFDPFFFEHGFFGDYNNHPKFNTEPIASLSQEPAAKLKMLMGQLGDLLKKGDSEGIRKLLGSDEYLNNRNLSELNAMLQSKGMFANKKLFANSADPLSLLTNTDSLRERLLKGGGFQPQKADKMQGRQLLNFLQLLKFRKLMQ